MWSGTAEPLGLCKAHTDGFWENPFVDHKHLQRYDLFSNNEQNNYIIFGEGAKLFFEHGLCG